MKYMLRSDLDEQGREVPDPRPMVVDVSPRGRTMQENIQRLIRNELSRSMSERGNETFDEANDFEVDDDDDTPMSRYQEMEDEVVPLPPGVRGAGGVPQHEGVPVADLPPREVKGKEDLKAPVVKPAVEGGGPHLKAVDLSDLDMDDLEAEFLRRKWESRRKKA